MRTIQSLLEYNISEEQKNFLRQAWLTNGIGWEWQNIEKTLLSLIELIPWYDVEHAESLLADLRCLAVEHDLQYFLKLGFYWSNYKFARKLYYLTNWWQGKRFTVSVVAFYTLNKYGKVFYNK
jgi:hypothetical protein